MNTPQVQLIADSAGRGDGGPFFLFPLLLLIGVGIWLFLRRRNGYATAGGGRMNPMATLQDRFARGEITREELEYRRAVLKRDKHIPPAPPSAPPAPPAAPPAPPSDD